MILNICFKLFYLIFVLSIISLDNRTEPNLDDLGLTFKDFNIVLQEIEEYINNVESVPPVYKVAAFPVKHPSNLQHPKHDSRELSVRPDHIPSYLPLMHPDEGDYTFI